MLSWLNWLFWCSGVSVCKFCLWCFLRFMMSVMNCFLFSFCNCLSVGRNIVFVWFLLSCY